MRAGYYRPAFFHALKAGLDASGNVVGWQHRLVGQSIATGSPFESEMVKNGVDALSVEGAANLPYAVPAIQVDLHSPKLPVPVLWWRSVGSTHTAFYTETFVDELAAAAKKDPVEFRRGLLARHPRHLAVLELAAKEAGWGKPLAAREGVRRGRGIAVHESFGSVVAEVAEVSVKADGSFNVERVVCAVDAVSSRRGIGTPILAAGRSAELTVCYRRRRPVSYCIDKQRITSVLLATGARSGLPPTRPYQQKGIQMDAIRIAGAQSREQAPQAASRNARNEAPEAAIRTLDDWELLLAGGGSEVNPEWP